MVSFWHGFSTYEVIHVRGIQRPSVSYGFLSAKEAFVNNLELPLKLVICSNVLGELLSPRKWLFRLQTVGCGSLMGRVEIPRTLGSHAFIIKILRDHFVFMTKVAGQILNSNGNIYKVLKCEKHNIGKS